MRGLLPHLISIALLFGTATAGTPTVTEDEFFARAELLLLNRESIESLLLTPRLSCAGNAECRSPAQVLLDAMVNLADEPGHGEFIREQLWPFLKAGEPSSLVEAYLLYLRLQGNEVARWDETIRLRLQLEELPEQERTRLRLLSTHNPHWPRDPYWSDLKSRLGGKVYSVNVDSQHAAGTVEMAADLLFENPPIERYKSGRYAGGARLVMFCPGHRRTPCLMFARSSDGTLWREPDGRLWRQPSLALSKYGKPYNERNGDTPSGVYQIDGVMPYADQQEDFGKFRRLILNFIARSPTESFHRDLLPESSHGADWWHEAVVARDLGRGLFRIHGSGHPSDANEAYYPFVPTSGCVAQRENNYNGSEYTDQRLLLDTLMASLNLDPVYENEPRIFGLLYVMNLGTEAVTFESVRELGIVPAHEE